MTIGEKIASLRRARSMSQEALADALHISRQAVSKWEADIAAPSRDKLVELAALLQVSTDELLRPDEAGEHVAPAEPKEMPAPVAQLRRPGFWGLPIWAFIWLLLLTAGLIAMLCYTWYVQSRLEGMIGSTIITVPGPSYQEPAAQDFSSYTIDQTFVPGTYGSASDRITLTLRATPREHDADETAQFLIQGAQSYAVDAVWADGQYSGEITVPLEDTFAVSLATTVGNLTKTHSLEVLYDLAERYRFEVNADFTGSVRPSDRGSSISGEVYLSVTSGSYFYQDEPIMWLTSGKATLYEYGEPVKAVPYTMDAASAQGVTESRFAAHFAQMVADPNAYFLVEATDNLGRSYERRVELPTKMETVVH